MKHLTWRKGLLYAMLVAMAFNSLACSNSLQSNSNRELAKHVQRTEKTKDLKPKEEKAFDEFLGDVGQFAGGAVEVTMAVAICLLEVAAESPCLLHCLLCHHH